MSSSSVAARPSASASASAPGRASSMGRLEVAVLKASGAVLEGRGAAHRIRLTLGHASAQTPLRKLPSRGLNLSGGSSSSTRGVDFGAEQFTFAVGLPTDLLSVHLVRGDGPAERVVGTLCVALAHLPQSTPVCKYFELKAAGQSVGVLQLRLTCTLAYSMHRRDATAALTVVPSQPAREFIRRELAKYAAGNRVQYRLVEYFLVVGCDAPAAHGFEPGADSGSAVRNLPTVLERYPLTDRPDFALPMQLGSFVCPLGYSLSSVPLPPRTFSFRLTHQTAMHSDQSVAVVLQYWKRVMVRAPPHDYADEQRDEYSCSGNERDPSRSVSQSRSRNNAPHASDYLDGGSDDAHPSLPRSRSRLSSSAVRGPGHGHNPPTLAAEYGASPPTASYRVAPSAAAARRRNSIGPMLSARSSPCPSPVLIPSPSPSLALSLSPLVSTPEVAPSAPDAAGSGSSPTDSGAAGASADAGSGGGGGGSHAPDLIAMYAPTSLVILSRLSFVPQYTEMLVTLYRHFLSPPEEDARGIANPSQADCPVCADDSAASERSCAMADAAVLHHNTLVEARQQQHEANLEASQRAATLIAAASASCAPPVSASVSSSNPSAGPSGGHSKNRHRMDLSGLSGNMWSGSATIGAVATHAHQPDISAFGSLPVPPTPASEYATPATGRAAASLPYFPDCSSIQQINAAAAASAAAAAAVAAASVAASPSPVLSSIHAAASPPPLPVAMPPFAPFPSSFMHRALSDPSAYGVSSFASPSQPAATASFCHAACCTCSCCTVRVDCRGRTLEQCIMYLADEAPLPLPGSAAGVALHLCCRTIRLRLPASELDFPQLEFRIHEAAAIAAAAMASACGLERHDSPLRFSAPSRRALMVAALRPPSSLGLLDVLGLDEVLLLLRCILCEMKIIVHSESLSLLHACIETLLALCFPFAWSHIAIPLLPRPLYGMLEAPVAFIVGVHSDGLPDVEAMLGVHDARSAGQRSRYREARDRTHSMSGADFGSVNSSSGASSGGGYDAADSDEDEPSVSDSSSIDLASFAFVDLDRGAVDVTVPPPPFPAAAVKALQRSVRAITKPILSRHDEMAAAHFDAAASQAGGGSGRNGQAASSESSEPATDASMQCNGGGFHLHYHPSQSTADSHADADAAAVSSSDHASPFVSTRLPACPSSSSSASESVESGAAAAAEEHVRMLSRSLDRSLRVCFLQFFASLIDRYRDFLFFARGATPVFDTPAYMLTLRGPRADALPFLSRLLETQIWRDFLDRHVEVPSFLQDYLLYINSHDEQIEEEEEEELEETQTGGDGSGADDGSASWMAKNTPFDAPAPAQLQAPQWASLVYSKAHFYARSLERQPRVLPDPRASVAAPAATADAVPLPEYLCHASLFASRAWGSAHMPVLGLLSAGALPPDLPVKLRSRSSSVGSSAAAAAVAAIHQRRGQSMEMQGDMSMAGGVGVGGEMSSMLPPAHSHSNAPSGPPSPHHASSGGPVIRATHIFPRARKFVVTVADGNGSGGGGVALGPIPSFAPGRNPSTLTSTLLFSKLFDGIQGSLSDGGSGANSRIHTPKHSQGDMTPAAAATDDAHGGGCGAGAVPTQSSQSIFHDAFSSFNAAAGAACPMGGEVSAGRNGRPAASASSYSSVSASGRNGHGLAVSVTDGDDTSTMSHRSPLQRTQSGIERGSFGAISSPPPVAQSGTLAQSALSSAAGALISTLAPPRARNRMRQMSLNLLSKSAFEKQKRRADSRLGQVVSALMAPRIAGNNHAGVGGGAGSGSGSASSLHVDLGELSAVGELLALHEWRAALVSLFGSEWGLVSEGAPHRRLPTSAFLSLALLFGISLEECSTDGDYATALDLLHLSGKIYHLPAAADADDQAGSASPGTAAHTARPEREYLRATLRRQPLWRDDEFWRVAYCSDIQHRLDHSALPSGVTGGVAPAAATSSSGSSCRLDIDAYESLVFELVLGLIHLQLSLGVATDSVRAAVQHASAHFGLREERRLTLHQLVANIARSSHAMAMAETPAQRYNQSHAHAPPSFAAGSAPAAPPSRLL